MPAQIRVLNFGDGSLPIHLDYPDSRVFSNCSSYGDRVLGRNWNEITVHHRGQLNYLENPQQMIMEGLYQAVDGAEFYPVCYQCGSKADTLLARNCKAAIDNLFNLNLTISLDSGASIPISVQLGVAEYRVNQISPPFLIARVVTQLITRLVQKDGVDGLLNLDNFGDHPEFRNIVVSLGNPSILMNVCQVIRNDSESFRVNGFILSNNHIRNVRPLTLFANVDYALLDLSGNKIKSADRLCRALEQFRARELRLDKNPIARSHQFPGNIKSLGRNFKVVNGVPFDMLYKAYSPLDGDIDLETDGSRLDANNTWKVSEYENSQDWHAFMVPDPVHEFSQDMFFNFFFIGLEPELSEFYPCYYKYIKTDHVFLVRNCFDQIANLVKKYNLEMWIPPGINHNEGRMFRYYLRMNVSTFKQHHVDPEQCIQKAVQSCYVPQNRLLNLDRFQSNENLQNVVVPLSLPKVLNHILSVASRLFMATCSEIRLCRNKILNVEGAHVLRRMGNLRAVDLSHNWVHELPMITSLGELPLKSLVLHGNPLCRNYSLPSEYVRAVTELFPQLTTLDGVDLQTNPGQSPQKNFLCDTGAYELVGEVFLKNYLLEFEREEDRCNLIKYYSADSLFTLTCNYSHNMVQNHQTGQLMRRLSAYSKHARNLHRKDSSNASNGVYVGSSEIADVLFQLPRVSHDFASLQTDVMHYDGQTAIIYVTGLLRDEASGGSRPIGDVLLGFSRQFVIKFDGDGLGLGKRARRLKITNERLNIMKPSNNMIRNAFSVNYPNPSERECTLEEDSLDVKDHKLILFQEVTGLISTWCTSIVEEAEWDFERAMKLFIQKNEDNEIPDLAFA
ncbi:nuclear RNA export factor 2 isoform X2 [Drosophila rhopaloa]|uniref:Nuclear RNA export factor 2 isoform X2 n=1 Tax=Drosophila rhopaloa TaxID=1041015 RepID=A0A6P4EVE6_DRORH|nr:nuclear RNA export factor 2 isoform X2 [Drosophila rhopaloa]